MSDKIDGIFTLTAPVTLSFANLFEPRRYKDPRTGKESGEPKYDAMLVFPFEHPDLPAIKALCADLAKANAPSRPFAEMQFPLKLGSKIILDGIDKAEARGKTPPDNAFLAHTVCITARSQYAPMLSILTGGRVIDYRDEARATVKDKFYSGVQVLAELNFAWHQVGSNTPGVTAYLNKVLSLNKGERIAGGKSGAETFGGYIGRVSTEDPTIGMAHDEIPL